MRGKIASWTTAAILTGGAVMFSMTGCGAQAGNAAVGTDSSQLDILNVQNINVSGKQAQIFDVNHDGIDLICTSTIDNTQSLRLSCLKKN